MNAPADPAPGTDTRQDDVYVVFTPSGRRGFVPPGTSVLDAARALGVDLDSVCGGRSMCGRCQIQLSEGEFAKFQITSRASSISASTQSAQRYAEKRRPTPARRPGRHAPGRGPPVDWERRPPTNVRSLGRGRDAHWMSRGHHADGATHSPRS